MSRILTLKMIPCDESSKFSNIFLTVWVANKSEELAHPSTRKNHENEKKNYKVLIFLHVVDVAKHPKYLFLTYHEQDLVSHSKLPQICK